MIKITKNILSDTISFDLAIKLKSIDLYTDKCLSVDIKNLIINEKAAQNTVGYIEQCQDNNILLTIFGKDISSICGAGDSINITEYSIEILREIELKKSLLIQENKKNVRKDYKNNIKFSVSRHNVFGYIIEYPDILNADIVELMGAMNKHDEEIIEHYPEIKNTNIELSLKDIVEITHFKKDDSYVIGGIKTIEE
ncbi:hypothetical protein QYZ59_15400 [Clostridium perfringens]|uniref:hypothetical protein n=1 Tax=Clostridium perfringens TaxID=1502 RepID=UPI00156EAB61|nr:hypothetical protein [Clostridium perfringens]EGT0690645.1 hypothetical protein [Clostridium perfringens]EGT0693994.1 hypothetical protein [Clostridium perfringens]EGT0696974.1 hypothetical protein [Clostridium perfringens]MBI6024467.1 hypothetical protein [Clostridium perfringens]MBI6048546.1 hypothetical protein [Clostridium perfringens]